MEHSALIQLAEQTTEESDIIDFKQDYAPERKAAFWAEIVKDIAALANTKGGILVFGIDDSGALSPHDCSGLFTLDNATLADQIRKYTSTDYTSVRVAAITRGGRKLPAIIVDSTPIPLVFTRPGTYETAPGKQKTAFSVGSVYFRHGSKSEPGTRTDLQDFLTRQLNSIREEWLGNIRRVVEAEPGSTVVVASGAQSTTNIRVTSDPNAPIWRLATLSKTHPYRQGDVIRHINSALAGKHTINTHDIQAIKCHERIKPATHPGMIAKPHEKSSPQYSDEFIELIISRTTDDETYFTLCRETLRKSRD